MGTSVIDILVGKSQVEVITFTQLTPAGRALTAATPQNPVYYVAATSGFKDLGASSAGEAALSNDEAIRTISKALAGQGYLPASGSSPAPSLLLVFTWGTLNVNSLDGDEAADPDRQLNRQQRLQFVGVGNMKLFGWSAYEGTESFVSLGLSIADAEKFQALASQDLFIACVSAYDLESAKRSERKRLWITRISCPASGFSLHEVMSTMLTVAAPHLGRETKPPVWVNASERKTEVKIRDLKVLEYLENGALPVLEVQKNKLPAAKKAPK